MNHCTATQILFSETYTVPAEPTSKQFLLGLLPHVNSSPDQLLNAMPNGYLVAVLESICVHEMQPHLDHNQETIVVASMQSRHRAPIPQGALVTVDGWVTGIGDHEASFWVRASDEQEIVFEGEIRFAIVKRAHLERKIQRKRAAIDRRQLFAAA
jgi:predicted thioesterase